jgi:DNA-binding NarL/FixJ family response regulator
VTPDPAGSGSAPIRVLLVDEDPLARQAIRQVLLDADGFSIAAEASSGEHAVRLALDDQPDVVVIDVELNEIAGLLQIRQILDSAPLADLVILSANCSDEHGLLAICAGAVGYLSKGMELAALPRTLRSVRAGEAAVSRAFTRHLISRVRQRGAGPVGADPGYPDTGLSPREWEVLDLVCHGDVPETIAEDLGVSSQTVRRHLNSVVRKLDLTSLDRTIAAYRADPDGDDGPVSWSAASSS